MRLQRAKWTVLDVLLLSNLHCLALPPTPTGDRDEKAWAETPSRVYNGKGKLITLEDTMVPHTPTEHCPEGTTFEDHHCRSIQLHDLRSIFVVTCTKLWYKFDELRGVDIPRISYSNFVENCPAEHFCRPLGHVAGQKRKHRDNRPEGRIACVYRPLLPTIPSPWKQRQAQVRAAARRRRSGAGGPAVAPAPTAAATASASVVVATAPEAGVEVAVAPAEAEEWTWTDDIEIWREIMEGDLDIAGPSQARRIDEPADLRPAEVIPATVEAEAVWKLDNDLEAILAPWVQVRPHDDSHASSSGTRHTPP